MFNHRTFSIHRLMTVEGEESGSYKRAMGDTHTTITGHLQQATAEVVGMSDGIYGRTFSFFSDALHTDVRIGDRLIQGDREYEVKGVFKSEDGPGRRIHLVITEPQAT